MQVFGRSFLRRSWLPVALGVALAAPVAAQVSAETEQRVRASFAATDADASGGVDLPEFVAHVRDGFASLDKVGDRELEPGDVPDVNMARFRAADRNANGTVSLGEAVAERVLVFEQADANRDGLLSIEELLAYEARRK